MNLEKIANGLQKVLPQDVSTYKSKDDCWTFYKMIYGYYNDQYFHLTLSQPKGFEPKIELAFTTENPKEIISLIKAIDEGAKVTYFELEPQLKTAQDEYQRFTKAFTDRIY